MILKKYIAQSDATAQRVETVVKTKAIPKFLDYAVKKSGEFKNNWILATLSMGKYKGDYWLRGAVNYVGLWANTTDEVVCAITSLGSDNLPLGDGKSYEIHYTKENLPKNHVNSFWSIILVNSPSYRVIPNDMNRYNFNNYSNLTYEEDGSLKLYVSPKYNEEWPKSNWLPSPKDAKLMLTMRMYVPKGVIEIKANSNFIVCVGRTAVNSEDSIDTELAEIQQEQYQIGPITEFYLDLKRRD